MTERGTKNKIKEKRKEKKRKKKVLQPSLLALGLGLHIHHPPEGFVWRTGKEKIIFFSPSLILTPLSL